MSHIRTGKRVFQAEKASSSEEKMSLPARSSDRRQATVTEGKCGTRRGCPGRRKPDKVSCVCHSKDFGFYSTDACPSLQGVPISKACRFGLTAHHPILFSVLLNNES